MPGKSVFFYHDIHDSAIADKEYVNKLYASKIDFFCVSSKYVGDRIKQQVLSGRDTQNNKRIGIIPCGYPRLDRNIDYFRQHNKVEKTIIFATTAVEGKDMVDLIVFPNHADKIIDAIMENFPEYNLIFRPHPLTTHKEVVQKIATKYYGNPRFTYDNNASSYIENYSKSALMITDMSGTAYTYALTTLRPVVFFLHDPIKTYQRFGEYQYFKDIQAVGAIASDIPQLINRITSLLANAESYREKIRHYRNTTIYNLGYSEDAFVESIDYIIKDKLNTLWEYV
jgi:hypothetical protein